MARTISEIYNQISTTISSQVILQELQPEVDDSQTLLTDLTSPSKVANWRLWKWIVSVAIWVHENLWDLFRSEVDNIVESARWGSLPWWQQKCLDFQYGDSLEFIDRKYQYIDIDPEKQIIKRAAAVESGRLVILKVAKLSGNDPVKLSGEELTAFQSYINKTKPPGTNTLIRSLDPDTMKLSYTIYYDPAILNSSGVLLSDGSTKPVEDAINNYIAGIVWDGTFKNTKAVDSIQKATGVVDLVPSVQYGKAAGVSDYRSFPKDYRSTAGYMIIDPEFPLETQINYIANV